MKFMWCQLVNAILLKKVQVDLEYPDELHELHNDFPLAPEKTCCF